VRHLAPRLADTEVGARQGFRVEQPGFPDVVREFLANQASYGERAGITQRDLDMLLDAISRRDEIDKHLYKARMIFERLEETRSVTDDEIQRMVFGFAQVIDARAKAFGDTDILGLYERVRAYRSAIGLKAAKTRRRNEAELGEPQNEESSDALPGELPGEPTEDLRPSIPRSPPRADRAHGAAAAALRYRPGGVRLSSLHNHARANSHSRSTERVLTSRSSAMSGTVKPQK
jgi:hypothetical protein